MLDQQVKIYCGDKPNLPIGHNYSRFGSRNECMKCGYGSAMYKYRWAAADNTPRPLSTRTRSGCLRSRNHDKGIIRGNQFMHTRRDNQFTPSIIGNHQSKRSSMTNNTMTADSLLYRPLDSNSNTKVRRLIVILTWILACITTFVLLYKLPPGMITKIDNNKNKVIIWSKFFVLYFILVIALLIFASLVYFLI